MNVFKKILSLVIIALLGGMVYAALFNLMVLTGLLNADTVDSGFGMEMTQKAVMMWLGCVAAATTSLFLKRWWRYILFFSPLYGPSAFAVIYVLMQQ